jgi:hypothetical protein
MHCGVPSAREISCFLLFIVFIRETRFNLRTDDLVVLTEQARNTGN